MLFSQLKFSYHYRHRQRSLAQLTLLLFVAVNIGACNSTDTTATKPTTQASQSSTTVAKENQVVRIGYQKFGTLNILKAKGTLEPLLEAQGISVQWVLFPAGPQLLEALNAGSIDFGHTGEAPPIFAQAAGAPLLYVASQTPNPTAAGLLVPKDSPIKTLADLKGKKVALNKGSNVHFLLVKALEEAGLKYEDIQPVFLPPGDARVAFEQGSVDAWAIWDPFFTAARRATNARVLKDGEGLVANREFYLASQSFAQNYPERVEAIIEETKKADSWAKEQVNSAAQLLSPQLGIEVPILEEVLQRRPAGIEPIQPDTVAYQQEVADTFFELKLLPNKIQVKEVIKEK